MKRAEILDTAKEYVTKDRAATHGDMEDNFARIAEYWSAHLEHTVTPSDVAVMMTLLKLARVKSNEQNPDNWIDGAGYLACGGEIATASHKPILDATPEKIEELAEKMANRPFDHMFTHDEIADKRAEGVAPNLSGVLRPEDVYDEQEFYLRRGWTGRLYHIYATPEQWAAIQGILA